MTATGFPRSPCSSTWRRSVVFPERRLGARRREDEDAVPVVVGLVRPGVVLEGVEAAHADRTDRAPVEVAEVDEQIGGDARDGAVEVLGPVSPGADAAPARIRDRLDARDEVVAYPLVVGGVDRPRGLPALHVHEEAPVVAAVAPRAGLPPVDRHLADGRRLRRPLHERQVPLAHQPLVEAEAAVHLLGAVVGDDQHQRVGRAEGEQLGQLGIHVAVVVADRVLEGVPCLVLVVCRVHVAPEAVVDAVDAHLDQHEEIPGARAEEVLGEPEVLVGLVVDALEEPRLVRGAEVLDVEHVAPGHLLDLGLERRRVGVLAPGRGREEAAHHLAVHRRRRVGLRHAEHDRVQAGLPEPIPEARHLHLRRGRECVAVVGVVLAVAEAVGAELARVAARRHRGPRRHRDGRMRAQHAAVRAARDETRERRQLVAPAVEHERRRGRVETDDEELRERHAAGRAALYRRRPMAANQSCRRGPGVPSTCRQRRPSGSAEVAPAVAHRRCYSAAAPGTRPRARRT